LVFGLASAQAGRGLMTHGRGKAGGGVKPPSSSFLFGQGLFNLVTG
jgi:hypothetical protein